MLQLNPSMQKQFGGNVAHNAGKRDSQNVLRGSAI
jgi:hypothetical protein